MNIERIQRIKQRLSALNPSICEIIDDSASHIGHAGAANGAGHFRLKISSEKFNNLAPLAKHRLVYETLGDLMQSDIHALVINIITRS